MTNYQTVKLSSGAHTQGDGKGCFMEVVSMLNREEWSDHPDCTCPAIAAFMRAFNDWLNDDERHVLWPYTTRVVGTNDGDHVIRAHLFAEFAYDVAQEAGNYGREEAIEKCLAFMDSILPEDVPAITEAQMCHIRETIPETVSVPAEPELAKALDVVGARV